LADPQASDGVRLGILDAIDFGFSGFEPMVTESLSSPEDSN